MLDNLTASVYYPLSTQEAQEMKVITITLSIFALFMLSFYTSKKADSYMLYKALLADGCKVTEVKHTAALLECRTGERIITIGKARGYEKWLAR